MRSEKFIRVEGIYDKNTLSHLIKNGITHFCFDFRVKSFNFLQQYKFLDFLRDHYQLNHNYYLRYEGERDYIIQKMIDDIKLEYNLVNFFLEFSGGEPLPFVEQYEVKFFYHVPDWIFRDLDKLKETDRILKSKKLEGIVLHSVRDLAKFLDLKDIKKILGLNWPISWDFVKNFQQDFDIYSFSIDETVEDDFRVVNLGKLDPFLEKMRQRM